MSFHRLFLLENTAKKGQKIWTFFNCTIFSFSFWLFSHSLKKVLRLAKSEWKKDFSLFYCFFFLFLLLCFCNSCYHHQTLWHHHFIGTKLLIFVRDFFLAPFMFPAVLFLVLLFLLQFHNKMTLTRCFYLFFLPRAKVGESKTKKLEETQNEIFVVVVFQKSHLALNFKFHINLSTVSCLLFILSRNSKTVICEFSINNEKNNMCTWRLQYPFSHLYMVWFW